MQGVPWLTAVLVTADCVTVAVLIALPLCLLWRVKLPTGQRRMILCIFASSVILAFAAIFHLVGRTLSIGTLFIAGIDFQVPRVLSYSPQY